MSGLKEALLKGRSHGGRSGAMLPCLGPQGLEGPDAGSPLCLLHGCGANAGSAGGEVSPGLPASASPNTSGQGCLVPSHPVVNSAEAFPAAQRTSHGQSRSR